MEFPEICCSTLKSTPKPNDGAGHNLEGAASLQRLTHGVWPSRAPQC